jgi:hypothetical protein
MDKKNFVKMQEACCKDVERAFGVLQSCFAIFLSAGTGVEASQLEKYYEGLYNPPQHSCGG